MAKIARLLGGTLVTAIAIYLWLLVADGMIVTLAGTAIIGACVAATLRSRWALVLIPSAVMVGVEAFRATACPDCSLSEDTPFVAFVLSLPFYGGSALLGATLRTALTRYQRRGMML